MESGPNLSNQDKTPTEKIFEKLINIEQSQGFSLVGEDEISYYFSPKLYVFGTNKKGKSVIFGEVVPGSFKVDGPKIEFKYVDPVSKETKHHQISGIKSHDGLA